tara:strand:+ start:332 stop:742 length:411 start_codon:yes stop_codon:yes gene_type:complete
MTDTNITAASEAASRALRATNDAIDVYDWYRAADDSFPVQRGHVTRLRLTDAGTSAYFAAQYTQSALDAAIDESYRFAVARLDDALARSSDPAAGDEYQVAYKVAREAASAAYHVTRLAREEGVVAGDLVGDEANG